MKRGWGENTQVRGSWIYTTRVDGWRVLGIRMDEGEGCLHKYGNFVNQVSWRSVVEFFREIEGNVISQFSTASFFHSFFIFFWEGTFSLLHEGATSAIWRAINRQFIRWSAIVRLSFSRELINL